VVGGVLADFLGYRAAFFSTGVTLALSGVIVLKWVDSDSRPAKSAADEPGKAKKFTLFPDIKPIVASPVLVTLMLVSFGVNSSSGVVVPMLPLFLKELVGDSTYIASSTGLILGAGAASTAIAAVMVGKFSARVGYWKTLIFCISMGAGLTVPQAFVRNIFQLAVLRALSCFFTGGWSPVINAIIAVSADKKNQGSVYGINSSVASAGQAIGPLIGSVVAMLNYRATFVTTACILGLSAWKTSRRRKQNAGKF
jgi:DHA1 family multidrug resistance protein-like MFS transporter